MEEWKTVEIKDICTGIYEGPHATPKESQSGGIYLGIPAISEDGHINFKNAKRISEDDLPLWTKRVTPQEDDIVFTNEATLNLYAIIPAGFHGCLGRRLGLIRLNKELVNVKYLFYYFFSPDWRETISRNKVSGATVERILMTKFPHFPVKLPPLTIQNKIATILSSLDDKIENNRKINENLEQQAQALFKSWFVDFEPFRDQPFVESELGMIPEGWRVGTLGNICTTNKRNLKGQITCSIKYLDTGNITRNKIENIQCLDPTKDTIPSRARRCVIEGDIVYSTVRPNQEHYGFLVNPPTDLIVSTGFCVITANWSVYRYYIYQYLIQDSIITKFQAIAEQSVSTYPSLNASDIENLLVVIPSLEVAEKYAKIVLPLYLKMEENQSESHRLSHLRDTLLPKLMSGEIKL